MKAFGEYIRKSREDKGLPLRKVAAALDIDTSILSKIERNERRATTEMISVFAQVLDKNEKEVEIQFLHSAISNDFGKMKYLKDGLNEIIKSL